MVHSFDLDSFIERLYRRELLEAGAVKELCEKAKEVLIDEGNVRSISAPATLVGDVHGQFYDVLEIFKIAGNCPDTNYVFLGDYVDRGLYSVETITLLTCLKLRYPDRVTLVRGNHESRAITQTYGFYTECHRKYGNALVWSYFTDMFDYLVLSVVIDDTILCVHGGLSPSLHTIDQIRVIDRFREIPHEGPMADLVWSDPIPSPPMSAGGAGSDEKGDFLLSPRGAGYLFGSEVTRRFLHVNGLGHVCRAHQLCMEGYQILFDDLLSTVWSAPNYCYRAGNMASVLEIGPGLERFFNVFGPCPDQFRETPAKEESSSASSAAVDDAGEALRVQGLSVSGLSAEKRPRRGGGRGALGRGGRGGGILPSIPVPANPVVSGPGPAGLHVDEMDVPVNASGFPRVITEYFL
ncbi:Metallo-dependent phosphatase-like protein [Zopfochytrium polystomum]|nr:Metallo-dependent phosphatase-like protein [Zopfochytrium polystomum]